MKKKDKGVLSAAAQPAGEKPFSLISDETLCALYSNLLKCSLLGQRAGALLRERGLKSVSAVVRHSAPGVVAVVMDLSPDDSLFSLDEDIASAFLRGASPHALLRPADQAAPASVKKQLFEAVGEALVHKTHKNARVICLISSQFDSEEWIEALDIARMHSLPMVFVSQDRRALEGRPRLITNDTDQAYLPQIAVDGQDVVAVYRVAHESIARARRGRGPTLIECKAFHVQGQPRTAHDAIQNMENYLAGKGLLHRNLKKEITKAFSAELDSATN